MTTYQSALVCALAAMLSSNAMALTTGDVWINEFHYDNSGADAGEFIEVAGAAGLDLSGLDIVLYNGSNGTSYNTINLSGTLADQSNGFGTASFAQAGIQNGSPDGFALVEGGNVIQFLSYEGSFNATNGPANGQASVDVGVSETSGTPTGSSLQLIGSGSKFDDFVFAGPGAASPGAPNGMQEFVALAPVVKILNQNFDDLAGLVSSTNADQFSAGTSDNPLTNTGASYDGASPVAGAGTPFDTFWTDTRGNEGPRQGAENGDFIGVSSFTGAAAPGVDAAGDPVVANFQFNDGDGRLDLVFDNIDASSVEDVQLMFDFWVNDTGFESTDSFEVVITDGVNSATVLSFGEVELEAANTIGDTGNAAEWNSVSFDVSGAGVTGDTLTLTFSVDTNAGTENIFIDGIMLSGTELQTNVPEPTTLALLGFGALAISRRRRTAS